MDDAEAKRHDDERFLRAYPAAVKEGRWEEVARLLSGKCRQLERKAAAANNAVGALVSALKDLRDVYADGYDNGLPDGDPLLNAADAALALSKGENNGI